MKVFGDVIEANMGVTFCLSTMAAAALGNTLSDIFGKEDEVNNLFH